MGSYPSKEKKWSSKQDQVLDEEREALERCEEEIVVRKARVAWLEQMKADDLGDRSLWRSGLPSLPSWKQKGKTHAGKRRGSKLAPTAEKKRKVDEAQVPVLWDGALDCSWILRRLTLPGEQYAYLEMKETVNQVLV